MEEIVRNNERLYHRWTDVPEGVQVRVVRKIHDLTEMAKRAQESARETDTRLAGPPPVSFDRSYSTCSCPISDRALVVLAQLSPEELCSTRTLAEYFASIDVDMAHPTTVSRLRRGKKQARRAHAKRSLCAPQAVEVSHSIGSIVSAVQISHLLDRTRLWMKTMELVGRRCTSYSRSFAYSSVQS